MSDKQKAMLALGSIGFVALVAMVVLFKPSAGRAGSPEMQQLLNAAAEQIRGRSGYCPQAIDIASAAGSANYPVYRVTCNGSRGIQRYSLTTDSQYRLISVVEYP